MRTKGYVLIEGYGEIDATQNLVVRLTRELGLALPWAQPIRWPNLHQWDTRSGKGGLQNGVEFIRRKPDAGALLVLRDEDDA